MGKVVNGNFSNHCKEKKNNNFWNTDVVETSNNYNRRITQAKYEDFDSEEYSEEELEKIIKENEFFVKKANNLLIEQRDASRKSVEIFYKIIDFLKDKVQTLDEEEKANFLEKAYVKVDNKNQDLSLQILKIRLDFLKRRFELDILEEDDFSFDP